MTAEAVLRAQHLLGGPWPHLPRAIEACKGAAWSSFCREVAPPGPALLGRLAYRRCLDVAAREPAGPFDAKVTIVPLWACEAEEVPSTEWVAVHAVLRDGRFEVREPAPLGGADAQVRTDELWVCSVRRWHAAIVVRSRAYPPPVHLLLRAGAYGVLPVRVEEVVAVEVSASEPLARPVDPVPAFTARFRPRLRVAAELAAAIEAMGIDGAGAGTAPPL